MKGMRWMLASIVVMSTGLASCGGDDNSASSTLPATTSPATTSPATTSPATTSPATTSPATTSPADTTTSSSGSTSVPSTTEAVDTMVLSAYFVRDERVALVHRTVPSTVATTRAALGELLAGPSPTEASLGMSSAIPAGTTVLGATIVDGLATIDLSGEYGSGGGSLSMQLRLAQVVYTVTQFPSVESVVFEVDGQPVTVFGSEGIVLDHPLSRADFEDETPAIFVDAPAPFDRVGRQLHVSGTANVFEATFMVRVVDAKGTVVYEHFQMATSGTGTRGTFDFTVDVTTAAHGAGLVRLWEPSSKDGSDINVVEIPIEL